MYSYLRFRLCILGELTNFLECVVSEDSYDAHLAGAVNLIANVTMFMCTNCNYLYESMDVIFFVVWTPKVVSM